MDPRGHHLALLGFIHAPFWFSVVAGGFVAAIFGLFIAIPVLRLGGDYLGIATLGSRRSSACSS